MTKTGAHLEQWIAWTSPTFYNLLFQCASKMHKLLILLIETADVLCSIASLEGEVLFGISYASFANIKKKLHRKINAYLHQSIN